MGLPVLNFSSIDVSWVFFVSFGIWFTIVCVTQMVATAYRLIFSDASEM
jgi:hypothetical protein